MIAVTLYVRQEGALGQFWTRTFHVPDGTPTEVLAYARQQCYAEKLEVGGVEHVARDPATVPQPVPGEPVLQEGNPDIQGVVIRVGRSTAVEFRGNIGYGRHTYYYADLAVFSRRPDNQLVVQG